ncbi:MAG: response regulator transcription factor [Lachnospiraceae bacterium]|nr:response regulator transcription factor [Lachnospiraceae bacterium]
MRILICDDDVNIQNDMRDRLTRVFEELVPDEVISITAFSNAFSLRDYMETKKILVDAIFMDITLSVDGRENGIDIAKRIKEEHPNISIVFYTGNVEYAEKIFEVDPLWLLLKPTNDDRIRTVLKKLIEVTTGNEYIVVKKVGELHRVNVNDIFYVESQGKYVKVHTDKECLATINKLDNIMEQLGENFVRCHKSYLVNIKKVKQFTYSKLVLFDDTEILVSRSYKAKIKDVLLHCV